MGRIWEEEGWSRICERERRGICVCTGNEHGGSYVSFIHLSHAPSICSSVLHDARKGEHKRWIPSVQRNTIYK